MKFFQKTTGSAAAAAAMLLTATPKAEAAITVTFREVGSNVVATIQGTLNMAGYDEGKSEYFGVREDAHAERDNFRVSPEFEPAMMRFDIFNAMYDSGVTMSQAPDHSNEALTFGIFGRYLDASSSAYNSATPTITLPALTMTWSNVSYSTLLGSYSWEGVKTVWQNPNVVGDSGAIQWVNLATIPEPSSSLLVGICGLLCSARRKRRSGC